KWARSFPLLRPGGAAEIEWRITPLRYLRPCFESFLSHQAVASSSGALPAAAVRERPGTPRRAAELRICRRTTLGSCRRTLACRRRVAPVRRRPTRRPAAEARG